MIVGTNFDSAQVNSEVHRGSKSVPTGLTVPKPNVIENYNSGMGGVDKLDWMVNKYRIMIRSKKWYWNLVTNMVDVTISNAHILYNLVQERKVDLLDFRRSIAVAYLKTTRKRKIVAPGSPSRSLRYDNMGHFIITRDVQRRCQGSLCKSKPKNLLRKMFGYIMQELFCSLPHSVMLSFALFLLFQMKTSKLSF